MLGCRLQLMSTEKTATATRRPVWATLLAIGFIGIGAGALVIALGIMAGGSLEVVGIGSALLALGVSIGSFGGYNHFASR